MHLMRTEETEQPGKKNAGKPALDQRAAYTIGEFASLFGKHKNWAYRLVYANKVKVIKPLGEMLVPRSEAERLTAAPVDFETLISSR